MHCKAVRCRFPIKMMRLLLYSFVQEWYFWPSVCRVFISFYSLIRSYIKLYLYNISVHPTKNDFNTCFWKSNLSWPCRLWKDVKSRSLLNLWPMATWPSGSWKSKRNLSCKCSEPLRPAFCQIWTGSVRSPYWCWCWSECWFCWCCRRRSLQISTIKKSCLSFSLGLRSIVPNLHCGWWPFAGNHKGSFS